MSSSLLLGKVLITVNLTSSCFRRSSYCLGLMSLSEPRKWFHAFISCWLLQSQHNVGDILQLVMHNGKNDLKRKGKTVFPGFNSSKTEVLCFMKWGPGQTFQTDLVKWLSWKSRKKLGSTFLSLPLLLKNILYDMLWIMIYEMLIYILSEQNIVEPHFIVLLWSLFWNIPFVVVFLNELNSITT